MVPLAALPLQDSEGDMAVHKIASIAIASGIALSFAASEGNAAEYAFTT